MKKRLNRVLALFMTCSLLASNIPVYAAGDTDSDSSAGATAENVVETDEEADESIAEQPAEEPVKEEEGAAEDAVSEDEVPAAEEAASVEDDTPVAEEADAEDDEYVDITDECTIENGVLSNYTGKDHAYIAIPSGVSRIEYKAFSDHSEIKGVQFPSTLTDIGNDAFSNCTALELVELPTANPLEIGGNAFYQTSMAKGTGNGNLVIPANVTEIGRSAFAGCTMLGSVTFVEGSGTIKLGERAFQENEHLSKITLSSRTQEIPDYFANNNTQLEEVIWSSDLKIIGEYAFADDTKLASSDLSNTVLTRIKRYAFNNCTSLPIVKLPTSVDLMIDYYAFHKTSMNSGDNAGDLIIPSNVTLIYSQAFSECSMLGSVTINDGSTFIGLDPLAFSNNERLTSITLSERVKKIPQNFADKCKLLKEVTWPKTLTEIGSYAFYGDEALVSSDLSDTALTNIDPYAFCKCSALPLVKLPEKETLTIGKYAFNETCMNDGTKAGTLVIPENVIEICEGAFYMCSMLGEVIIDDGANALKMQLIAFGYNESLTKIAFSDRVTEIPRSLAFNCKNLEEVVWPAGLTTIGNTAFDEDEKLKSSDLSNTSVTSIGEMAFNGCKELPLVKFPATESLTIGSKAFKNTSMKDGDKDGVLVLPAGVTSIGSYAFSECSHLGEVQFEEGGNTVDFGVYALSYCPRLLRIDFSDRVSRFPYAFAYNSNSLIEVCNTSTVTEMDSYPFHAEQKNELILINPSEQMLEHDWKEDNRVLTESASSVVLPQDKYIVEEGKTIKLEPVITVYPAGSAVPKLIWKSLKADYASVDDEGNVKGIKEIEYVYIIVQTEERIQKSKIKVQVVKKGENPGPGPVDPDPSDPIPGGVDPTDPQPSIKGDTTELTLVKGQKFVMAEKDWKSDNKCLQAKKGKIFAKKAGTATLSRPGSSINVQIIVPSFEAKSVTMTAGEEKAVILNGTDSLGVYYLSTNPDVASVDEDGNVTAYAKGKTVIQAYVNGVMYKCSVAVKDFDASARTFSGTVEMAALQTVTVKASGFKAKKAGWSSSDQEAKTEGLAKGVVYEDAIVRITDKGKLTAIGAGSTTLTATGGGTELQFTVHVNEPVVKELHMNVGAKKAFKLTGIKKQPEWTIEDTTIASRDKGKIVGSKAGQTTMTGKCENFDYTVNVYVEDPAIAEASGKPYNYSITIKKGETKELMLAAVFQPIAFKSNKSDVAFMSADGKLYGRSKGKANITAKVNGKTVKLKVTVN